MRERDRVDPVVMALECYYTVARRYTPECYNIIL